MRTEEHVHTWDTVTYDYLHIAYKSFEKLSTKGVIEANGEAFGDVLKCCIFSFLCIDGIFNYLWHIEYEERKKNNSRKEGVEYWKKIETPKKWIKKNPYERINLLSLAYSGKEFFESGKHSSCLDIYKDYIELRNALLHASPDITYTIEKYLDKSDVGVARYSVLNVGKITPKGRRRTSKKCHLSEWINLKDDLHQTHALEVYKFTLALLYRTSEIFFMSMPFNGIHFQKDAPGFKEAYNQLPKCHFNEILKKEWNMSLR